MGPKLELQIQPLWDEIDRVRDAAYSFLAGRGLGRDIVDAVAMVTCELSENAVKYGDYRPGATIEISISQRAHSVLVEVKNPVSDGTAPSLTRMDEIIQWIRGHQDPFEAYLERLEEVSTRDLQDKESGLGLVRIAYEGQSILDFYVDENKTLAVSAMYTL